MHAFQGILIPDSTNHVLMNPDLVRQAVMHVIKQHLETPPDPEVLRLDIEKPLRQYVNPYLNVSIVDQEDSTEGNVYLPDVFAVKVSLDSTYFSFKAH